MYIELETLFDYRQYTGAPVHFYFDRKTYQIVDAKSREAVSNVPYERYLPLFQIDEEAMQEAYILQLNRKDILYAYRRRMAGFREFVESYGLWEDWWQSYCDTVCRYAMEWCRKNHINYKDSVS